MLIDINIYIYVIKAQKSPINLKKLSENNTIFVHDIYEYFTNVNKCRKKSTIYET